MDGAHNLDIDVSTCARLIPPPGTVAGDHWPVCRCRCRGGAGSSVAGDNGMLNYCHCPIVIEMMLRSYQAYCADIAAHTPPEGGVRTKKCYMTFDTIFGHYLPRGTLIDGSQKCRMVGWELFA